ncbi:3-oxoacyl-[acyl-carrier protein] reductase [Streptosporangium subroseum]|uniref:3-oxoacyl-[acyl-carrier protein] reductase n=1 Tax=Streptosporangium subroseum TaxID=106412 RepID=A0A239MQI2_9ACTN|nr:SDR family oxidoreductase [Streptosporangium subroseum]SNT44740.1 3-oxoacyl-[acyl-carrier protein] reductase [Streptosporangium subroseum]
MQPTLTGKVALVAGGSRGIGAAIARTLARQGASVAITYNASADRAKTLAEEINAEGGQAITIKADATDRAAVREAVEETVQRLGRLDILVNNAGVGGVGPIEEITEEGYDHTVAVNLHGVFFATQAALRHMGGGGRIIIIGSINADRIHFGGGSVYALTKAAVAGFARGLAREIGSRGITVNTIQPGPTNTEMNPEDGAFAAITKPFIAVDRYGTVDEVASLVAYLAGPDAAYITGATINVDGGYAA